MFDGRDGRRGIHPIDVGAVVRYGASGRLHRCLPFDTWGHSKLMNATESSTISEIRGHAEEPPILILYATKTGNSLDAAELITHEARRWHFRRYPACIHTSSQPGSQRPPYEAFSLAQPS